MAAPLIALEGVWKFFGGVTALRDVTLQIEAGAVHALVGENGAGKSTLGNLLAGVHRPDRGRLLLQGRPVHFRAPRDALRHGIAMVHQELSFCPNLTVAQNLCLADLPRRRRWFVDRGRLRERAERLLAELGASLDVDTPMGVLSTGEAQLVQIAHAVGLGARVIVFDEPTSALSEAEAQRLFRLVRALRDRGVTAVYVTHRLEEVRHLCDTVSVLRDGRHVATGPAKQFTDADLVRLMAGRAIEVDVRAPPRETVRPQVLVAVENLSAPPAFTDISFELRAGEILGFAGLVGSGRSDLLRTLFGLQVPSGGSVFVVGKPLPAGRPRTAMARGLGLLPEDRKTQALVFGLAVKRNISLASLPRLGRRGLVSLAAERGLALALMDRLRIKAAGPEAAVETLSGGNQQKVALARWLARESRILLLDEPTRGVDVRAKAEIHRLIVELARAGRGIVLVSSELPELTALAHRILVMRGGRIVAELPGGTPQPEVLRWMVGAQGEVMEG